MIEVRDVVYEYPGKRALKGVSFHLEPGSITALVGPNGAGKTTLLRCLAALDEPFSGSVTINNIDTLENPRLIHRQIGYLSDFFGLYDNLTVEQCLTFTARIHEIPRDEIGAKVKATARRLEIGDYLNAKAGTLSRGLRQRLGIAQAIIHDPTLLLLDEPASGLDPEARSSLSKLFQSLREQGMTLIVSSHILTELEDYCTSMLLLRDGRILEHCTTRQAQQGPSQGQHPVEIRVLHGAEGCIDFLKSREGVSGIKQEGDTIFCEVTGNPETLYALLKEGLEQGLPVFSFAVRQN